MHLPPSRLLAFALVATAAWPAAHAQDFKYACSTDPVEIAIPGGRLDRAVEQLRLQTRCPISGTKLAKGKRSKPVVGTMEPEEALQALLDGTGLEEQPVKGGFQIVRTQGR